LNFIGFYGVLLEFEKRMSVNMQEINSKLWIIGRIMEGANTISNPGVKVVGIGSRFSIFSLC